ncbi:uncharacterized protein LOC105009030 isoform X1 [Tachysurus ichikawai]
MIGLINSHQNHTLLCVPYRMSEPTDDSFKALVRALHQLIKAYHHLSNTKISEGNTQGPRPLKRAAKRLESVVKPANPTSATGAMLYGNARNWLHNSLQILEDHYTSMIQETIDKINTLPLSEGSRAWDVALRWARRNFKTIKTDSIQKAHVEFQKILKQKAIPNPNPLSDPAPHPDQGVQAPHPPTATPVHTAHKELDILITQIRQTTDLAQQGQGQLAKAAIPPGKKRSATTTQESPTTKRTCYTRTHNATEEQQTKKRLRPDKFERHPHLGDKYRNWDLKPQRPILILGDSNLSRLPRINNPAVQVDCYPGAKLSHAHYLIKYKTPTSMDTQRVVLSFGLNDRTTKYPALYQQQITKLIHAAGDTFPNATLHVPSVNFDRRLPHGSRANLDSLNRIIGATGLSIPILPRDGFQTLPDNIHWTLETANAMWEHWSKHLNLTGRTPPDRGPSKTPERLETEVQVTEYHRRLKIISFFGTDNAEEQSDKLPFTNKSGWEPPPRKIPQTLKDLIQLDKTTVRNFFLTNNSQPSNLTDLERRAIKSLKNNKSIIIKPADKGNGVVIMDRSEYVQEALRQLNNPQYYKKLDQPIYVESIPIIQDKIKTLLGRGTINRRQATYLRGDPTPRPRQFYLLPKIHKPQTSWPTPSTPPGRPIVSDCGSESYRTAEFLDYYLNPLSTKHDSYIRDTYDFIDKVKSARLEPRSLLFTIDINDLYTNIDTAMGLNVVKQWLVRYPDEGRPDDIIMDLLELNLTKNDFEFNGDFYLQVKGTAMGKKFAPAYANIYMAHWEQTALAKCSKLPTYYFRYLDDIWGVWDHSQEQFLEFVAILNNHHHTIKLKHTLHRSQVDFLDTTTYKGKDFNNTGKLDIKVFFKETDSHALLHGDSYHPKHTFRGIIKAQLLRFGRICTQKHDFEKAKKALFNALRGRGYTRNFLRSVYTTWRRDPQHPSAHQGKAMGRVIVPLVFKFSKYNLCLSRILKNNFHTTFKDDQSSLGIRVLTAFTKNPNLKDLLVRSKLLPPNRKDKRTLPDHLVARNPTTRDAFKLPRNIPLNTPNCVYLIRCKKCGKQYIGETRNSVRARLTTHRYNIRHRRKRRSHLVSHFLRHGLQAVRGLAVEHKPTWSTKDRKARERHWMRKLNTQYPHGLNDKC